MLYPAELRGLPFAAQANFPTRNTSGLPKCLSRTERLRRQDTARRVFSRGSPVKFRLFGPFYGATCGDGGLVA